MKPIGFGFCLTMTLNFLPVSPRYVTFTDGVSVLTVMVARDAWDHQPPST